MSVPTITLSDGREIPQLGFGVFQIEPDDTAQAVTSALEVGYRHIDTAQMYGNEAEVGEALAATDVPRDELFVTTKLNNGFHAPDDVKRSFEESRRKLGLEQVDLFLIHWPLPTRYDGDFTSTWRAMTQLVEDGVLRSAGVSNFTPGHLRRIVDETGVAPVVNQIEVHPFFANDAAREASHDVGAVVEGWSPIAQGAVLDDDVIGEIAADLGRTPSQVTLRWHVERGDVVFPKSTKRERMEENFAIFDFSLTPDQVAAISALDRGADGRTGPDPEVFDYIPD